MLGLGLGTLHPSLHLIGFLAIAEFYKTVGNFWEIPRSLVDISTKVLLAKEQHCPYDDFCHLLTRSYFSYLCLVIFSFRYYWGNMFLPSDYKKSSWLLELIGKWTRFETGVMGHSYWLICSLASCHGKKMWNIKKVIFFLTLALLFDWGQPNFLRNVWTHLFKHNVIYDANSHSIRESLFSSICLCKTYMALEFFHLKHNGQLLKVITNS